MKKIVYILLLALAFFSCQKPEDTPPVNNDKIEVVFAGITTEIGSVKSTNIVDCDKPDAVYAQVKIDNTIYRPLVFYIDGLPYTQSIKLSPGTHSVKEFMLMNDNNTPETLDDDIIVSATPVKNSTYAVFVDKPVDFPFQVNAFAKTEVKIQVLCFEDADYQYFGFDWFALTEITVREQIFFGDICIENLADYEGSWYEGQENGLQVDMPAIFRIDVFKNGAYIISYDNDDPEWLGEGEPLHVLYPDNNNANDKFEFNLYIYVRNGNAFAYTYYKTWTFFNNELISAGNDGVVDFVLGDCNSDYDEKIVTPVQPGCQISYAYNIGYSICFLSIQGFENTHWGWTNGKLSVGNYDFTLFAGVGDCNTENGRQVGTVSVNYNGANAIVTYQMLPGYTLDAVNLYVGLTVLYEKEVGVFTNIPEEFPIIEDLDDVSTATYTISGFAEGDEIYVIAHAKACGPGL
jgi:hypothetical protein